jgi:hypothetical protein
MDVLMGLVSYRSMVTAGHSSAFEGEGLERVIDLVLDGIAVPRPRPQAESSSR